MWREIEPDEKITVTVDGHKLVAYSFGTGKDVLLLVNGGPGLPCDYLREAHSCFVDQGFRVVAFDQLDCGASDRPNDPSDVDASALRARDREAARKALASGRFIFSATAGVDGRQLNMHDLSRGPGLSDLFQHGGGHAATSRRTDRLKAALGPRRSYDAAPRGAGHVHPPRVRGRDYGAELPPRLPAPGTPAPVVSGRFDWNMAPYRRCRALTSYSTLAISATGPGSTISKKSRCRC